MATVFDPVSADMAPMRRVALLSLIVACLWAGAQPPDSDIECGDDWIAVTGTSPTNAGPQPRRWAVRKDDVMYLFQTDDGATVAIQPPRSDVSFGITVPREDLSPILSCLDN